MRLFFDLTKSGIVVFVLVTGMAGYAMSQPLTGDWNWVHFLTTMAALYFLSSGSFAINQAQEVHIDREMPRTQGRPLPSQRVSKMQAWTLGIGFVLIGAFAAILVNQTVFWLGLGTVFLYNVTYTLWWKRHWAFGAVPGAIPGATPVLIGYAAHQPVYRFYPEPDLSFSADVFLADAALLVARDPIQGRLRDKVEFRCCPFGSARKELIYHMAMYAFAYVATAAAAPYFTSARWAYAFLVLPLSGIVVWQFLKYFKSVYRNETKSGWLPFFLWTNLSILVFLAAPVVDRWLQYAVSMAEVEVSQEEG
jgi:protoheme IX farnesyltransferase